MNRHEQIGKKICHTMDSTAQSFNFSSLECIICKYVDIYDVCWHFIWSAFCAVGCCCCLAKVSRKQRYNHLFDVLSLLIVWNSAFVLNLISGLKFYLCQCTEYNSVWLEKGRYSRLLWRWVISRMWLAKRDYLIWMRFPNYKDECPSIVCWEYIWMRWNSHSRHTTLMLKP